MADFEDATAPTWDNLLRGQQNLRDAVRGDISYQDPAHRQALRAATEDGDPDGAARAGWHLPEQHYQVDGQPAPASLFDFGLFLYHNARALVARGSGPYFYLPKMESHLEARLWNDVFLHAQARAGPAAGDHPGHGADRDASRRRSRWTRSCGSCASTPPG